MVFGVTGISTLFAFCDGTDGWRPGGICSMADDLGMDKSVIGLIPTANWFLVLELAKKRARKGDHAGGAGGSASTQNGSPRKLDDGSHGDPVRMDSGPPCTNPLCSRTANYADPLCSKTANM